MHQINQFGTTGPEVWGFLGHSLFSDGGFKELAVKPFASYALFCYNSRSQSSIRFKNISLG